MPPTSTDPADLFEHADRYPNAPGFKARDTSAEAAEAAKPKAPLLRNLCLDLLIQSTGLTADEVAGRAGFSVLSIRPRLTELSALGLIVDSGERRRNDSGKRAIVWKVA